MTTKNDLARMDTQANAADVATASTNKKASATPGPWTWRMGPTNLYHAHERRLITTLHGDGAPIAKMGESYGGDYLTAEANARLLAAAPQLLEALKTAGAAINPSDRQGISLLEWNDRLRAATVVINAAIAKAEGRA